MAANDPERVAAASKKGHEFPFFAREPNYIIELKAIPYGAKVATVLALDVLGR